MSTLERTLEGPGTIAVGEYTRDGKLVEFRSKEGFSGDLAAIASQYAAAIDMYMATLGASFSELSRLPLVPFHGWLYTGGDMTSNVQKEHWAILRTSESEFRHPPDEPERGLDELLAVEGVRFAAYYLPSGAEIAHKQTLGFDRDLRKTATEIVASGTATLRGLAVAFSHLSKTNWNPPKVWIYSGGDWTIAASETCWLLAEAGEARIGELHRALMR